MYVSILYRFTTINTESIQNNRLRAKKRERLLILKLYTEKVRIPDKNSFKICFYKYEQRNVIWHDKFFGLAVQGIKNGALQLV